jgi:predicted nucleic acid-binding protein
VIVLDASAVFELLLNTRFGKMVAEKIRPPGVTLHAPHVLDLEIIQVLRRYVRNEMISEKRAAQAVFDLQQLDLVRYPHEALVPRIWALRHNLTAYDAAYVALSEAMDAPLITLDKRLAASSGHRAEIVCFSTLHD